MAASAFISRACALWARLAAALAIYGPCNWSLERMVWPRLSGRSPA